MATSGNDKIRNGTKIRRRGRPRLFDRDVALAAAQEAFARKGYAATTLEDLGAAMQINRPSLYAAFSDKEALYLEALRLYADRMQARFARALDVPHLETALRRLYQTALDAFTAENGEVVGCMIACTAVTEAVDHEPIKSCSKGLLDEIDQLIARRISRAIEQGELPASTRPRALARIVIAVLHSLSIRARAGAGRRTLDELAEDAVQMIVPRRS